jgi:hypothetical protein
MWSRYWNENWQGKPKYSEKTSPSATLCIKNSTLLDLGSKPSHREEERNNTRKRKTKLRQRKKNKKGGRRREERKARHAADGKRETDRR